MRSLALRSQFWRTYTENSAPFLRTRTFSSLILNVFCEAFGTLARMYRKDARFSSDSRDSGFSLQVAVPYLTRRIEPVFDLVIGRNMTGSANDATRNQLWQNATRNDYHYIFPNASLLVSLNLDLVRRRANQSQIDIIGRYIGNLW